MGPGGSVRGGQGRVDRPRKGVVGRAQRNSNFFIYSDNFQMSSNCFDKKVDLPSSKSFK
jgi:hypothetical protein